MEGPSDGYEMHPAIPTAKPPAQWYQSTQKRTRNPSLGTLGWRVRTVLRDPDGYGRGWGVGVCSGWDLGKPPDDGGTPDTAAQFRPLSYSETSAVNAGRN